MLFYDIISMGSNVPLFMYAICLVVGCKTSKSSPVISPKRKSFCCDRAQRISVLIEYPRPRQMAFK